MALQVANNQAKLQALSEIERDVRESESNARGFIITKNKTFVRQQDQANQELKATFKRLSELLQDSPSQAANLKTLNKALTSKQALIQSSIALSKQGNSTAAKEIVNLPSVAAMERLNTILDYLKAQSNEQLETNIRILDQATQWARSFVFVAGAGLLGLLISNLLLFRHQTTLLKASFNQLAVSESLFREIFEQASMGRAIRSLQGDCRVNQSYLSMLGYSQAELEDLPPEALVQPDARAALAAAYAALLSGERNNVRLIHQYQRKDGSLLWVDENLQLHRDHQGNAMEWISTILDISQQKQLEADQIAQSHYARSLIEANPDPLININKAGTIQDVNGAMILATGLPRQALVGQDFASQFSDPERARQGMEQVFAAGAIQNYELHLRQSSGELLDVQLNARVFEDDQGVIEGLVAVARDSTERNRLERSLNELNATLETRVQERTAELKGANEELEAFSYSVSHDLRAPLRAVDGFTRKVVIGYADKLDAEGLRLLQVVRENAVRMGKLIDDLLAFSRLGRREMHLVPVEMETMAQSVADELINLEPERAIVFSSQGLAPASGDPSMLREVWINLIGNAIKFSRARNPAHIEVGCQVQEYEIIYWVKDDGAGFDMAYAEKLFGVFQRLHSQAEFEGSGVGLALSQRIIHRHHGRIWGEGKPDHGAAFYFTLPCKTPTHPIGTQA